MKKPNKIVVAVLMLVGGSAMMSSQAQAVETFRFRSLAKSVCLGKTASDVRGMGCSQDEIDPALKSAALRSLSFRCDTGGFPGGTFCSGQLRFPIDGPDMCVHADTSTTVALVECRYTRVGKPIKRQRWDHYTHIGAINSVYYGVTTGNRLLTLVPSTNNIKLSFVRNGATLKYAQAWRMQ